ncbi:chromatin remodelling complex Rsc7/Swp82 subunit-domain-containing protein [Daldinia caldariorum]|uniref:chromatin remodelling complex Rsc7/Swp82 subunit-domain-containing protein n=1 Tax=Daldinia caldariorum TaxID=326644 RepID=UPI002008BB45|nr:chromatin remodelling complex Rsc7/Swp82 subunit-domain-containing protein [Daldinia caldariorum]KAI1467636.1 chromatin remodelling complex Rsc7/Swp82 subunit-domain-containing protein [Daldinia caldariorum]
MPRRPGRAAAKRAAAKLESTPRALEEIEDEIMPDADASDGEQQAEPEEQENEDESGAEAEENQDSDVPSAKSPSPPPQPVIRRRRLGRPPKNRPPDWDTLPLETPQRDPNETPRRRGRGGWRGRGGRKGASYQPTQQTIDKEGNMMDIVDDEVALPEDPEGETKVDKMGNLQGGREYRCRTFTVAGRGDRLYMLSTEPARCVGFRDSYLFFTKHKRLYKIIVDDDEKRDMIERDIIPHSYKGRAIGIVTARSVFREFGALIIVGGKRIIDDYEVAKARAEGVVEGELADPNDKFVEGEEYNKNQYVAWHGASAVYHSGAPSVPTQSGKVDIKKRRVNVTDVNWQFEHAREASRFNSEIGAVRRLNLSGVYDVHTNMLQYPAIMQPTHARFEQVADSSAPTGSARFPPLDPKIPRNFKVIDAYMEIPPAGLSSAVYEQREVPDFLAEFQGLGAVSKDVLDELPAECREAFEKARERENSWKSKWGPESTTAHRRPPIIDAAIVPYSRM